MPRPYEFPAESLPEAVRDWSPEWGIVLGSGLGVFIEQLKIAHALPFSEVPGIAAPRVPGHSGRFVFTEIAGRRTVIAQGRAHLYEGHGAREVAAGVRFMAALGVRQLILTNAAGVVNPAFETGGWMMVTDHLNLTGTTPLLGGPNFFDMTEIYTARLRATFREAARQEAIALREGVYAGVLGPQYETPAEIAMLRVLGADAVGMSTVLEAIQARALGLEVAAFSCLTNWGAGLGPDRLNHGEVLEAGVRAAAQFRRLVERAVPGGG